MSIKSSLKSSIFSALALAISLSAFAAVSDQGSSQLAIEPATSANERHYLLDPVELTPVTGLTVINASAGFNIGAHGAYPLLTNAPLYLEPSFIVGIFSGNTMFNFAAGVRYDLNLPNTRVRPFARIALGPTFETTGSVAVFNASAGGGVIIPLTHSMDFRAEAAMLDINGNAGVQLMGGLSI